VLMQYYVYIIQSLADGSFYIGFTTNITERLREHNQGFSRYTSKKRPWKLVYSETFATKTEALKRERFLKSQRNREFYLRLIASHTVS